MAVPFISGWDQAQASQHDAWMDEQEREARAREINLQRQTARFRQNAAANMRPPSSPVAGLRTAGRMPDAVPNPVAPPAAVSAATAAAAPAAGLKATRQNYTPRATPQNDSPIISSGGNAVLFTEQHVAGSPELQARLRELEQSGEISIRRGSMNSYIVTRNTERSPAERAYDGVNNVYLGGMQDIGNAVGSVLMPWSSHGLAAQMTPRGGAVPEQPQGIGALLGDFLERPTTEAMDSETPGPPLTSSPLTERIGPAAQPRAGLPASSTTAQPTAQPTSFTGGGRTIATDIPEVAQGLLAHLRQGESGGRYDIAFSPNGTRTFPIPAQGHPGQGIATAIPDGHPDRAAGASSSAYGAYQFIEGTWNSVIQQSGLPNVMTPENQDRAAWFLAQRDYQARTGRNLEQDLANPALHANIMSALQPTWTSLRGQSGQFQAPSAQPGGQSFAMMPQTQGVLAPAVQQAYQAVSSDAEALPYLVAQADELYQQNLALFQAAQEAGLPEQMVQASAGMREANAAALTAFGSNAAFIAQTTGDMEPFQRYFSLITGGAEMTFQPYTDGTYGIFVNGVQQGAGTRNQIASQIMELVNSEYAEARAAAANAAQTAALEHNNELSLETHRSNLRNRETLVEQTAIGQRELSVEAFQAEMERRNGDYQVEEIDADGNRGVFYRNERGQLVMREVRRVDQRGPSTNGRGGTQSVAVLGPERVVPE